MKTINPIHLGDGAYAGIDPTMQNIWLGANHHENMTIALGPGEIEALVRWLFANDCGESVKRGIPNDG